MSYLMTKIASTCLNNPGQAYEVISIYGLGLTKIQLTNVVKMLLYATYKNCPPELYATILKDMGIKLNDMYGDGNNNNNKEAENCIR